MYKRQVQAVQVCLGSVHLAGLTTQTLAHAGASLTTECTDSCPVGDGALAIAGGASLSEGTSGMHLAWELRHPENA